ncbi:MAG TPA: ACP S-malonyltransferase [Dehalococcoidia bacterium]|nr:ACP S-malonyltransferase [Dehalococcoidia bacterium]
MASSGPLELPKQTASNVAWLFPGQGAQEVGMGRDLWESSPAGREVLKAADRVLGFSLTQVCFDGPEEKLRDTRITQPAIMAVSLAALAAALEAGAITARPAFVAGHSLGEYSALVAAGALSLEEGLRLIEVRARLMAEAGEANPGTLAAIMGMREEDVEAVCREAGADVCNLNLPDQTVVGGTREAVQRALALAKERGARRALELNVSGAFHSRLMRPAVEGLEEAVRRAEIGPPAVPVMSNVAAVPLRTADDVRAELPRQIISPVRWHQSVVNMSAAGVTAFVEFGPGKVLTGLVRRLAPDATLANVSTYADAGQLKM